MVQQVVPGTRYIDEAVLEILEDGLVWVQQDANWNVLALTDFAGRALERYDQTPYGIVTVDQESYFGDYDGDSLVTLAEVDSNTNGSLGVGDACWGSGPAGACRVLDFDFDDDVDAADKSVFDALVSADTYRRPGRSTSALGHTRFHQGLILDPEIGSFNNRARQYAPALKRFIQRDPLPEKQLLGLVATGGRAPAQSRNLWANDELTTRMDLTTIATLLNLDLRWQIEWVKRLPPVHSWELDDPVPAHGNAYEYVGSNPSEYNDPYGTKRRCKDWFKPMHMDKERCTREVTPGLGPSQHNCWDNNDFKFGHVDKCGPACASFLGYCVYCPIHVVCHFFGDVI